MYQIHYIYYFIGYWRIHDKYMYMYTYIINLKY